MAVAAGEDDGGLTTVDQSSLVLGVNLIVLAAFLSRDLRTTSDDPDCTVTAATERFGPARCHEHRARG